MVETIDKDGNSDIQNAWSSKVPDGFDEESPSEITKLQFTLLLYFPHSVAEGGGLPHSEESPL